jgi:hypothetical protein
MKLGMLQSELLATKPRARLGFGGPACRSLAEQRGSRESQDEEAAEPRRRVVAMGVATKGEQGISPARGGHRASRRSRCCSLTDEH